MSQSIVTETIMVLRVVHVTATYLFMGSIVSAFLLKHLSDASGSVASIVFTIEVIQKLDKVLTIPTAAITSVTGLSLAWLLHWRVGSYPLWLTLSIVIWAVSAAIATSVLLPQLVHLQTELGRSGPDSAAYKRLSTRWRSLSLGLVVSPFAILVLMLLRPSS